MPPKRGNPAPRGSVDGGAPRAFAPGFLSRGRDSAKDLRARLEAAHEALRDVAQGDRQRLGDLATALGDDDLLHHTHRAVRLLVACCAAEILRIYAPDAPFSDDQVKSIFAVMASQLKAIAPGADADEEHLLALELLTSLAEVKSAVLLVDFMEESAEDVDIFVAMIVNLLDAITPAQPGRVSACVVEVVCSVIEEMSELPPAVGDVILARLLPSYAAAHPAGAEAARSIVCRCVRPLADHLCVRLRSVLATCSSAKAGSRAAAGDLGAGEGGDDEDVEDDEESAAESGDDDAESQASAGDADPTSAAGAARKQLAQAEALFAVVFAVRLAGPAALLHVLPLVAQDLHATEEAPRLRAVALLGRLFTDAETDTPLARQFRKPFQEFLARMRDRSKAVRRSVVETAGRLLAWHEDLAEDARPLVVERISDPDTEVRLKAVEVACDAAALRASVPMADVLAAVGERARDRHPGVRKDAVTGLAQVFCSTVVKMWMGCDDDGEGAPLALTDLFGHRRLSGLRPGEDETSTRLATVTPADRAVLDAAHWVPDAVLCAFASSGDRSVQLRVVQLVDHVMLPESLPPCQRALGSAHVWASLSSTGRAAWVRLMDRRRKVQAAARRLLAARTALMRAQSGARRASGPGRVAVRMRSRSTSRAPAGRRGPNKSSSSSSSGEDEDEDEAAGAAGKQGAADDFDMDDLDEDDDEDADDGDDSRKRASGKGAAGQAVKAAEAEADRAAAELGMLVAASDDNARFVTPMRAITRCRDEKVARCVATAANPASSFDELAAAKSHLVRSAASLGGREAVPALKSLLRWASMTGVNRGLAPALVRVIAAGARAVAALDPADMDCAEDAFGFRRADERLADSLDRTMDDRAEPADWEDETAPFPPAWRGVDLGCELLSTSGRIFPEAMAAALPELVDLAASPYLPAAEAAMSTVAAVLRSDSGKAAVDPAAIAALRPALVKFAFGSDSRIAQGAVSALAALEPPRPGQDVGPALALVARALSDAPSLVEPLRRARRADDAAGDSAATAPEEDVEEAEHAQRSKRAKAPARSRSRAASSAAAAAASAGSDAESASEDDGDDDDKHAAGGARGGRRGTKHGDTGRKQGSKGSPSSSSSSGKATEAGAAKVPFSRQAAAAAFRAAMEGGERAADAAMSDLLLGDSLSVPGVGSARLARVLRLAGALTRHAPEALLDVGTAVDPCDADSPAGLALDRVLLAAALTPPTTLAPSTTTTAASRSRRTKRQRDGSPVSAAAPADADDAGSSHPSTPQRRVASPSRKAAASALADAGGPSTQCDVSAAAACRVAACELLEAAVAGVHRLFAAQRSESGASSSTVPGVAVDVADVRKTVRRACDALTLVLQFGGQPRTTVAGVVEAATNSTADAAAIRRAAATSLMRVLALPLAASGPFLSPRRTQLLAALASSEMEADALTQFAVVRDASALLARGALGLRALVVPALAASDRGAPAAVRRAGMQGVEAAVQAARARYSRASQTLAAQGASSAQLAAAAGRLSPVYQALHALHTLAHLPCFPPREEWKPAVDQLPGAPRLEVVMSRIRVAVEVVFAAVAGGKAVAGAAPSSAAAAAAARATVSTEARATLLRLVDAAKDYADAQVLREAAGSDQGERADAHAPLQLACITALHVLTNGIKRSSDLDSSAPVVLPADMFAPKPTGSGRQRLAPAAQAASRPSRSPAKKPAASPAASVASSPAKSPLSRPRRRAARA